MITADADSQRASTIHHIFLSIGYKLVTDHYSQGNIVGFFTLQRYLFKTFFLPWIHIYFLNSAICSIQQQ